MSKRKEKYYRDALNRLKEKRGPMDEDLKNKYSLHSKTVRAVKTVIERDDLHTVPEIKSKLPYESSEIFMAINLLMKYEGLVITNKRDSLAEYPSYSFEEGH
jgi:hypothetical protein